MKTLNRERWRSGTATVPNAIKNLILGNARRIREDNPEFNDYVLKMKELTRLKEVTKLIDGEILLGGPGLSYCLFLDIMVQYEKGLTVEKSLSYLEDEINETITKYNSRKN